MNDKKRTKEVDNKNSVQEKRIKRLQEELKQSNEEKLKLLDQNVFLTEEIINLQRRIADLEEKVYKDSVIKLVQR
ncbi:hypothetical protein QIX46_18665 [Lysinibacillus boronitolerans]|nr:hypothetical protein QIX46_18665 [Lysinibacillus boronitolerans]